jgi:hypothetical protein
LIIGNQFLDEAQQKRQISRGNRGFEPANPRGQTSSQGARDATQSRRHTPSAFFMRRHDGFFELVAEPRLGEDHPDVFPTCLDHPASKICNYHGLAGIGHEQAPRRVRSDRLRLQCNYIVEAQKKSASIRMRYGDRPTLRNLRGEKGRDTAR